MWCGWQAEAKRAIQAYRQGSAELQQQLLRLKEDRAQDTSQLAAMKEVC